MLIGCWKGACRHSYVLSYMGALLWQQVVRVAVEGRALLGRDVVSNLIDVVEAPLLLLLPKIIKPRNEEVRRVLGSGALMPSICLRDCSESL